MSRFREGQLLVYVRHQDAGIGGSPLPRLVIGRTYEAMMTSVCGCGIQSIYVGVSDELGTECPDCGWYTTDRRAWYEAKCFRAIEDDLTASLASKELERLLPNEVERINEPQTA